MSAQRRRDSRCALPSRGRARHGYHPTRDHATCSSVACVRSFERTAHPSFDVLVVDNGSSESSTRELFERWRARMPETLPRRGRSPAVQLLRLNNLGVAETDAPFVVLLNNDTEVIAPEWDDGMLGQARRPQIGAVGALLLTRTVRSSTPGSCSGGVLSLAGTRSATSIRPNWPATSVSFWTRTIWPSPVRAS